MAGDSHLIRVAVEAKEVVNYPKNPSRIDHLRSDATQR